MSISGSLRTMHLGDLLQWCASNLKTGTLRLTRGPIQKCLFFRGGRLFSSTSNSPRETLGQFLIRAGKITEEQLFKALIEQDRAHEPIGQILIREGWLDEAGLHEILRLKTEETIFDCFLWSEGDFAFEDGRLPENIAVSLTLDLTGVILEGARRADEWARIWQVFRSRFTTFARTEKANGADDLSDEELRVLKLIDKGKSVEEIALDMHAVDFYAASLLFNLHDEQLIEVVPPEHEDVPFEQLMVELRDNLREGVVCYNAGQYQEALSAFEEALAVDPHNKYAKLFTLKIERLMKESEAVREISLERIPVLKVSLTEAATLELDPQEGFVLSRINGEWDIRSILKICPMTELETLVIFKHLIDGGIIELQ